MDLSMHKVIVFSPNRYSLYSTTVSAMLIRKGVSIQSIYVRNLINLKRFVGEYRRDGSRLIKKIWKKLILKEAGYQNLDNISTFRKENEIFITDLFELKTKFGIPVIPCNDLNDPTVVDGLKDQHPDLVVFTGGGLIRQDVLDHSGHGVMNCHMGILPNYRGMDVVEWPILERLPDLIGITVHFMEKGVDTGDILNILNILPMKDETIPALRNRIEPIMCQTIVDTCMDYLEGKVTKIPQKLSEGKQYFKMHPLLQENAKVILSKVAHAK
jgi:methionyl-tRNA formyltransferase